MNPIQSTRGLTQGGVLSPRLFNLFIDDIKQIFDESCDPILLFDSPLSHLLYADDLVLMSNSKAGLQECLNKLGNEFENSFNVKQSPLLRVTSQKFIPLLEVWMMLQIVLESDI